MRLKTIVIVVILTLPISGYSQAAKIKSIKYMDTKKQLHLEFPIISLFKKSVENIINKRIQTDMLELTFKQSSGYKNDISMFNKIKYVKGGEGSYTSLKYSSYFTDKILTLNFMVETLGIYPDGFSSSYVFNLTNGELLQIDDLIMENKGFDIYDSLYKKNKNKFEKELGNIVQSEAPQDIGYIRETLQKAINDRKAVDFYIYYDTITFIHQPADFPHAMQAFQINFVSKFTIKELSAHFTNVATKILLNPEKGNPQKKK